MGLNGSAVQRPIFVAIGGDSGTGKSTLTAGFLRIFGEDRITTLCLDDYHGLDRRERKLVGITALDPRANNFSLMENQLLALSRGETVAKPVYDHHDGTFGEPEELAPREVVIVQGLHPFLVPGIRALFDLKVWVDPEEELKHRWKIQRDVAKRGYTREAVVAEIETRRPEGIRHGSTRCGHQNATSFARAGPGAGALGDVAHELRAAATRIDVDEQLKIQTFGEPHQRIEGWRDLTQLQTRDGGLLHSDLRRELRLTQAVGNAVLEDPQSDGPGEG